MTTEIISRCTVSGCHGFMGTDGKMYAMCDEPCNFCMMKVGHGDPPFLSSYDLVEAMQQLMLRSARRTW